MNMNWMRFPRVQKCQHPDEIAIELLHQQLNAIEDEERTQRAKVWRKQELERLRKELLAKGHTPCA